MRITKKTTVTREVEELVETVCDLCKQTIPRPGSFVVQEVHFWKETGHLWPSRMSTEKHAFDLCEPCFDRIAKWIAEQGGNAPRVTEHDT
jgi:hypothetical protein